MPLYGLGTSGILGEIPNTEGRPPMHLFGIALMVVGLLAAIHEDTAAGALLVFFGICVVAAA